MSARRNSTRSLCRCCRRRTGAASALHPRGNFEGYLSAASKQKWLRVHGDSHFAPFYRTDGEICRNASSAISSRARIPAGRSSRRCSCNVRHPGEKFVVRDEQEWPLARTQWTKFYLDPASRTLGREPKSGRCHRVRNHWRRRYLLDAAAGAGGRDHRAGRGQALRLVGHDRRRPLPGASPVRSRRQGGFVYRLERSHACRSGWAGCAPRTASSMPSAACPTVRTIRTMRPGR